MATKTLTPSQVAQLGGFAAARSLGADGRKARASAGADAVKEKYGREHYIRMAHKRHGRLQGKSND